MQCLKCWEQPRKLDKETTKIKSSKVTNAAQIKGAMYNNKVNHFKITLHIRNNKYWNKNTKAMMLCSTHKEKTHYLSDLNQYMQKKRCYERKQTHQLFHKGTFAWCTWHLRSTGTLRDTLSPRLVNKSLNVCCNDSVQTTLRDSWDTRGWQPAASRVSSDLVGAVFGRWNLNYSATTVTPLSHHDRLVPYINGNNHILFNGQQSYIHTLKNKLHRTNNILKCIPCHTRKKLQRINKENKPRMLHSY